jgi:hypothetical protein
LTLRITIGEWGARDPTQFALAESMTFETWRCYSLAPASVDSFRRIESCAHVLSAPYARSMSDPPRLIKGWTSLLPEAIPPLTFSVACKHHHSAPVREDSSPRAPLPVVRLHLQTRTASHTPGEERTLQQFRTPSVVYGDDALITRRPFVSWCPVKDATKRLHTGSPSLVPPRAFNATTTSLGLGTHDFA